MKATLPGGLTYDTELMRRDMLLLGLNPRTLAARTKHPETRKPVSRVTILRFLAGQVQTAPVARAIAEALGHENVEPYLKPVAA
jgi:hypothetical protein